MLTIIVGMDTFIDAIKEKSGLVFSSSGKILATDEYILNNSGIFKLDKDQNAIHFSIPSGIFKGTDLIKVANLANSVDGKIRLSVEQSLYIITNNSNNNRNQFNNSNNMEIGNNIRNISNNLNSSNMGNNSRKNVNISN